MKLTKNHTFEDAQPEDLAEAFASLCSDEQSRFYNHLGSVSEDWLPMQLQYITDDDGLTLAGRRVMQMIGEYSHWGVCADKWGMNK